MAKAPGEPPSFFGRVRWIGKPITLEQLLQRAAQEIATQAGANSAELAPEIAAWKERIGKWVRTVEAFYCLTKSPEWAEIKIDPFEKMVLRRLLWSQISGNEIGVKDTSSVLSEVGDEDDDTSSSVFNSRGDSAGLSNYKDRDRRNRYALSTELSVDHFSTSDRGSSSGGTVSLRETKETDKAVAELPEWPQRRKPEQKVGTTPSSDVVNSPAVVSSPARPIPASASAVEARTSVGSPSLRLQTLSAPINTSTPATPLSPSSSSLSSTIQSSNSTQSSSPSSSATAAAPPLVSTASASTGSTSSLVSSSKSAKLEKPKKDKRQSSAGSSGSLVSSSSSVSLSSSSHVASLSASASVPNINAAFAAPSAVATVVSEEKAKSDPLSAGIDRLFELIKAKNAVDLNLSGKPLLRHHVLQILAQVQISGSITSVSLRNASLDIESIQPLANWLHTSTYTILSSLDLGNNWFKAGAIEALVRGMSQNFHVAQLSIEDEGENPNKIHAASGIIEDDAKLEERKRNKWRKTLHNICEQNRGFLQCIHPTSPQYEMFANARALDAFPSSLTRLGHLRLLDLSGNDMTEIPAVISVLTNLTHLNVSGNRLELLAPQLGLLTRLNELQLSYNQLTALPSLGLMDNLELLDISENKLKELPRYLGGLKKLVKLNCSKNSWKKDMIVPKSVISKGDDAILAYLRNIHNSGEAYPNRMKLMFVGNENVGKTSLLLAFRSQNDKKAAALRSAPNIATNGIDITPWSPDDRIVFSAWDFAGQDVYYATHAFFLSPQAVYLVVCNLLADELTNKIEYWLDSIHARAGRAPVVIVGTHSDAKSDQWKTTPESLQKLAAVHKNIVHIATVSCVSLKGIKELQKEIVTIALKQKWMHRVIPKNYMVLQEKLQAIKDAGTSPYIEFVFFKQLALESQIAEQDVMSAADFLVNLGDIAFYPETRAADWVVLDSQWLTSAFASVITVKASFIKEGLLQTSALPLLWQSYPPQIHKFLLSLFDRFELMFTLDANTILIPSVLPTARPPQAELDRVRFSWDPSTELQRVYQLSFVPAGLFPRMMVRLLNLRWTPATVWRHGFILSHPDGCFFLELDPKLHLLKLAVRGMRVTRSLSLINDAMRGLINEWPKVTFSVSVPCPACGVSSSHRFDQKQLEESIAAQSRVVNCQFTKKELRLDSLVPDLTLSSIAKIDFTEVSDLKELGKGSYCIVSKCVWKGKEVAVKQVCPPSNWNNMAGAPQDEDIARILDEFRREVWLMSGLRHKNLIEMYGISQSPLAIIMEYMGAGNLFHHLKKNGAPSPPIRFQILEDIAQGMLYLHSHSPPIVHRDLKSPNILLRKDGSGGMIAKVADVGISRALFFSESLRGREVDCPVWLAPEILQGKPYNQSSDVYAFGVLMFETLTGKAPLMEKYQFFTQLEKALIAGQRDVIPEGTSESYSALLKRCWAQESHTRPAFAEVVKQIAELKKQN